MCRNARLQEVLHILNNQEAELTHCSDLAQAVNWWTLKTCAMVEKKILNSEQ